MHVKTFGPVAKLVLDSRNIRVHCAALDTWKIFLTFPHATDIVKSLMPRGVVDAVSDDLNSRSWRLWNYLTLPHDLKKFLSDLPPLSHVFSSALVSMPTAAQVTALRVLEIGAGLNNRDFVKAVADTFHYLTKSLFSPDSTVQIAALKILEVGAGTEDLDLARAVKIILLPRKDIRELSPSILSLSNSVDTDDDRVLTRLAFSGHPPLEKINEITRSPDLKAGPPAFTYLSKSSTMQTIIPQSTKACNFIPAVRNDTDSGTNHKAYRDHLGPVMEFQEAHPSVDRRIVGSSTKQVPLEVFEKGPPGISTRQQNYLCISQQPKVKQSIWSIISPFNRGYSEWLREGGYSGNFVV